MIKIKPQVFTKVQDVKKNVVKKVPKVDLSEEERGFYQINGQFVKVFFPR